MAIQSFLLTASETAKLLQNVLYELNVYFGKDFSTVTLCSQLKRVHNSSSRYGEGSIDYKPEVAERKQPHARYSDTKHTATVQVRIVSHSIAVLRSKQFLGDSVGES